MRTAEKYPTLDAFFPRIADFFNGYSGRVERDLAALDEEKRKEMEALKEKSPKVVSLIPANGAQDIDPGLEAIVVTFDRPMMGGNIAVILDHHFQNAR
jgi:hypothetical protein